MWGLENTDVTQAEDCVVIRGTVKGSIRSSSNVVIFSEGHCDINVKAPSLSISGEVAGDINVGKLEIWPDGQLYFSRAKYKDLVLHDGAVFLDKKFLDRTVSAQAKQEIEPDKSEQPTAQSAEISPEADEQPTAQSAKKPEADEQPTFHNSY